MACREEVISTDAFALALKAMRLAVFAYPHDKGAVLISLRLYVDELEEEIQEGWGCEG